MLLAALALVVAGAGLRTAVPPQVAVPRLNLQRVATAVAVERTRPTATPYPTPSAVPRPLQSRAEVLTRAVGPQGRTRVDRVDPKLMRLGDWARVFGSGGGPGVHPELWVWVVGRWGDGFEPFSPSLVGVPLTWEAAVWDALGGPYKSWFIRPFPPPGWEELPDYSR